MVKSKKEVLLNKTFMTRHGKKKHEMKLSWQEYMQNMKEKDDR